MPHISVMIPTFNHARFIGQTIESVLNQRFQDIDIVIIDDSSTDNTFEVVSPYCSDPRISYFRNERRLGLVKNWNRCLELAVGPIVLLLPSDDLIDPDYLELASNIFEAYPRLGFVYAPVRSIDCNGCVIHEGISRPSKFYHAGDEALIALVVRGIHLSTTVVKRECYEKLGLFDERIWHGPDVEFFARIAANYAIYDIGQVKGSFRVHESKAGYLGYLNKGVLNSYMLLLRLTYGYISAEGLYRLGINDLEKFIAEETARYALNGAIVMIAYKNWSLAFHYLYRVIKLIPQWWMWGRFWKTLGLLALLPLSEHLIRRRMKIG
jgi:glycosyltransferase involved in cell wall biosynthesis